MATKWEAVVDAMVAQAVSGYYDTRAAAEGRAHYLYFRPSTTEAHGALAWAPDAPEGFELADPRAERGFAARDQLARLTRERAARLPILCGLL